MRFAMSKKLIILGIVLSFCVSLLFSQTAVTPSAGNGSIDDPYQISSLENLYWIAEYGTNWHYNYIQTEDIDASPTQNWFSGSGFPPIGDAEVKFSGTYDGQGHTIQNLYINRSATDFVGLFGFISSGTVSNLGLVDAQITGNNYVGGIAGDNVFNGIIEKCFITGSVSGNDWIGGLIGINTSGGVVRNCYSKANVSGNSKIGGFNAWNNISPSSITNCYSCGTVTGNSEVGGFNNSNSAISAGCFWDTQVSGQSTSAAGTGLTTSEMKNRSYFTGASWDFEDIWEINQTINEGYPFLQWQVDLLEALVETDSIGNISNSEAEIYCHIISIGIPNITEYGVCWNSTGNPTISDDKTSQINAGIGPFTSYIEDISSNTLFYVRAYATNDAGTTYGQVLNFTTLETALSDIIPTNYILYGNYPNPFNPTTTLRYGLPEVSDVILIIFDITGHKIKEWSISSQQPGWHKEIWDGTDMSGNTVSTGVYIYSLRASDFIDTKKMVFLK
jgi:hypothetical protein